jgi:hypothetical protein
MPAIELVPPLTDTIARYRFDALAYVNRAFPWGQAGTSLAGESGPEPWQRDVLEKLGKGLMVPDEAVRVAVASGHGVGKSALVAWIILWAMSALPDTRGVRPGRTGHGAHQGDHGIRRQADSGDLSHPRKALGRNALPKRGRFAWCGLSRLCATWS